MPQAGFKPAIPMFKWPKTVLALDCAAIETGKNKDIMGIFNPGH
jgi:hypothetical protein